MYLRPGEFFRNQILLDCLGRWHNQSCQIFFQSVHSDVFGKGSNFAIFSVNHGWPLQLLYYCTTVISQLYGSTTVVMAIYSNGLYWKWRSLTPCHRHPSKPIEKIIGVIDNVIDLNYLSKFSFGKIFRNWGTNTQHIRVCAFFSFFSSTFYALRHAHSLNGWTDFDAQDLKRRRLVRGRSFSMTEKNRSLTLTFKRSKSATLFGLHNFDRHYLENGTRQRWCS